MKKELLLLGLFGLATATWGQTTDTVPQKWDQGIERLLRQQQAQAQSPAQHKTTAVADTIVRVIIRATDAKSMAKELNAKGYGAKAISATVLTARLPLSAVPTVAKHPLLRFINSTRKHRPFLNKAREATKVTQVHTGEGLDTPYKGKDVIVAVIDQGFQYNHPAFSNANNQSRIIALWDHAGNGQPIYGNITETDDKQPDAGGHGTHVTGIAAGSDRGNGYYGMAPEADLVIIPSSFDDADVLEEMLFIDSIAKAQGKPAVVNMSFGSTIGPHDGTTNYDQVMNEFIDGKAGRVITAAMGNEGEDNLHISHRFTTANDTVSFLVKPNASGNIFVDIWGQAGDASYHLTVIPSIFDPKTGNKRLLSSSMTARRNWFRELDTNNKKERYLYGGSITGHDNTIAEPHLLVTITAPAGQEFHAWLAEERGKFLNSSARPVTNLLNPDSDYCVGEGSASIPNAVAVGAYVSRLDWTSLDKKTYSFTSVSNDSVGQIAAFSNHGPSLGNKQKPTITAPGTAIISSMNRFVTDFNPNTDRLLTDSITVNGEKEYYGIMQGTSMASPAAAGIIALWLQANPNLTATEITEILRTTAIKDRFTFFSDWTKDRGYGKIDAYEGLKAALSKVSGLSAVHRSETPVTIQREGSIWRLLFGSAEQNARVEVFSMSGQLVKTLALGAVSPGTEATISFETLPSGVYVVRITTPNATIARKVLR